MLTQLDGTPAEDYRAELDAIGLEFKKQGVDLRVVEQAILRSTHARVRAAVRARSRLETFQRAVKQWRALQPLRRQLHATLDTARRENTPINADVATALLPLIAKIDQQRPPYYAHDPDGSYKTALLELKAEALRCWPRKKNEDPIRTKLLATITSAILRQLQPEVGQPLEHGLAAKANRLTARYVNLRYPTILKGQTEKRLRNRRSLSRRPRR